MTVAGKKILELKCNMFVKNISLQWQEREQEAHFRKQTEKNSPKQVVVQNTVQHPLHRIGKWPVLA